MTQSEQLKKKIKELEDFKVWIKNASRRIEVLEKENKELKEEIKLRREVKKIQK